MRTRLRIAISTAFVLLSLEILSRFLHWMNRPSDAWFYAGAFGALLLLVIVPGVVGAIWSGDFPGLKRP